MLKLSLFLLNFRGRRHCSFLCLYDNIRSQSKFAPCFSVRQRTNKHWIRLQQVLRNVHSSNWWGLCVYMDYFIKWIFFCIYTDCSKFSGHYKSGNRQSINKWHQFYYRDGSCKHKSRGPCFYSNTPNRHLPWKDFKSWNTRPDVI